MKKIIYQAARNRGPKKYEFPPSTDACVNLMPFVMGRKDTLPSNLQQYWPLIEACGLSKDDKERVGYLTVVESWVEPGETQRRPGLHVDSPARTLSLDMNGRQTKCH